MTRSTKRSRGEAPPAAAIGNEQESLRLELLRLTYHPGQSVEEVIERTKRFEYYVKNGSDNPLE